MQTAQKVQKQLLTLKKRANIDQLYQLLEEEPKNNTLRQKTLRMVMICQIYYSKILYFQYKVSSFLESLEKPINYKTFTKKKADRDVYTVTKKKYLGNQIEDEMSLEMLLERELSKSMNQAQQRLTGLSKLPQQNTGYQSKMDIFTSLEKEQTNEKKSNGSLDWQEFMTGMSEEKITKRQKKKKVTQKVTERFQQKIQLQQATPIVKQCLYELDQKTKTKKLRQPSSYNYFKSIHRQMDIDYEINWQKLEQLGFSKKSKARFHDLDDDYQPSIIHSSEASKYKAIEEPNLCYKVDKALMNRQEVTFDKICAQNNFQVKEKTGLFFDLMYANEYSMRQAQPFGSIVIGQR